MPAISIDTFFACSLMVILVLSAMAATSTILRPQINNADGKNIAAKYEEISEHLLLSEGTPSDWGQDTQKVPQTFGIAKTSSTTPYELDIDKATRLNSRNSFALSYAQIFTALNMPDVAFRIEIKPIFEVTVELATTLEMANETTYQFRIFTQRHGALVETELKCYLFVANRLDTSYTGSSEGVTFVNVTIANSVNGPGLLIVLAHSQVDSRIASFASYALAHNSPEPQPQGTFLNLSPVNHTLTASLNYGETVVGSAYAVTFNYNATLTLKANDNQSATYEITRFLDPCPVVIIVTGQNSTTSFNEWVAYPQVPLQVGPNLLASTGLSDISAYTYAVTIDSALYECAVFLGGPKQ